MTREIKRSSDKFVWIELLGLIGAIVCTAVLYVIFPNKIPAPQTWVIIFPLGFVALGLSGRVLRWIIGRQECKKGIHDPDSDHFNMCRYCHEPQPGYEEKVREFETRINQKHGHLKMFLPMMIMTAIMGGVGWFMISNESHDIVHSIQSMNQTSTACLALVKSQKAIEVNWWMPANDIKNAVQSKWTQLDCVHQNILDDLNHTCPIGVSPSLHGAFATDFTCSNNEVRFK